MALIKCPECGKEISDKAKQCPKCGWKIDLDSVKNTNTLQDTEIEEKSIIEIETKMGVPCLEPRIEEKASSDYKEQAKESQRTHNIAHYDVVMKSDREIEQDICEDKTVNVMDYKETASKKKGEFLTGVLIAGIVLIVLGVWSVVLVNVTASMIAKNLNVSTESIDEVKNEHVYVEPKGTNMAVVETEIDKTVEEVVEEVVEEPVINEIYNGEIVGEIVSGNSGLSEDVIFTFIDMTSTSGTREFHLRIANNSNEEINIDGNGMYINKTSVELAFSNYNSTIPAGYSNVFTFNYNKEDVQMTGNVITVIEKGFKNKETDEQFWVRFSGLNIQL